MLRTCSPLSRLLPAAAFVAALAACPAGNPAGTGGSGETRTALKGKGGVATARPDPTNRPTNAPGTAGDPTATPSAGPTRTPGVNPDPLGIGTPSPTPVPTPTPLPTATPVPPAIPDVAPSTVPTFDPKALSATNQALLVKIEAKLLAISRVSFSQAQSGLISDKGNGVVANNGAGVISNNGSSLLGNNGSGYRLQQLAPPVIAKDPVAPEILFHRRHWPDGSKTIQYRDANTNEADTLIRRIQLDAAGVAFDEFRQVLIRRANASTGESAKKRKITYFPTGAFSATYEYVDDIRLDGQLTLKFEPDASLFQDADGKTKVRIPAYEVDTTTGKGSFRYVFDHIGMEETGTLSGVALTPDKKINLNFNDPMTFYDGESTVKDVAGGAVRFSKRQVTAAGVVTRTYDLGEGANMALERKGPGRYDGDLKDGLRPVGTVRMSLLANGTTVFDIRFGEAPAVPYRVGFGSIPDGTVAPAPTPTPPPQTTTVAGGDVAGSADGVGTAAKFDDLRAIAAVPGQASQFYLADAGNHRVRRIAFDAGAQAWTTTAFVGDGTSGFAEGTGTGARFQRPGGLAAAADGTLYVADTDNHRIRKVTAGGVVTTYAGDGTGGWQDGAAGQARFNKPSGLLLDTTAGDLYVADTGNHCIRRIAADGTVTTIAGDRTAGLREGAAAQARFNFPAGLASDGAGNLIVADEENHRLRLLSAGQVTTLAGDADGGGRFQDGPALDNGLFKPCAVATDGTGGRLIAAGTLRRLKDGALSSLVATFTSNGATADGGFKDVTFASLRGMVALSDGKSAVVIDRHAVRVVRWP